MEKKITIFALHLDFGGIEKYISLLCKMLDKNYDIEIISTYKYKETPAFDFSPKIKIKYLINDYPDKVSIKKLLKEKKYIKIIKEIIRRQKIKYLSKKLNIKEIKNLNTNYVITTRTFHNELINKHLKNNNIIKIATEHNYHNNDAKYIKALISSVTNFDYVVHCTDELYDYYKDKIKGPKNIKIYNPVHFENNKTSKLNTKNIIAVGRLSEEKGFLDLIGVMHLIVKQDKNIKLTICGDGYQRDLINSKIKELKLNKNIKLTGFIKGKRLENEYLNASLFVLPSISEAFGLVLLEAMHFALPCIAFSTASGARNLLKNNVGILIENRDKQKMADTVIDLLNNPKKLKEYGNKSKHHVENYSLDKIKKEWEKIIK